MKDIMGVMPGHAKTGLDEFNPVSQLRNEDLKSMKGYFDQLLFPEKTQEEKSVIHTAVLNEQLTSAIRAPAKPENKKIDPGALLETQIRLASIGVNLDFGAKIASKLVQGITDLSKMQ